MTEPYKLKAVDFQTRHHFLALDYRNQERLVQSESFAEAWDCANDSDRKYILTIFRSPHPLALKRWILRMLFEGLEQYPIKILRELASYHKIKNYSRINKDVLLAALTTKGVTNGSKDI